MLKDKKEKKTEERSWEIDVFHVAESLIYQ